MKILSETNISHSSPGQFCSTQHPNSTVKYTLLHKPDLHPRLVTKQMQQRRYARLKGLSELHWAFLCSLEELIICWPLMSLCFQSRNRLSYLSFHTWANNLLCLNTFPDTKGGRELPKIIVNTCISGWFALYQPCMECLPSCSIVGGGWALQQIHFCIAHGI